MSTTANLKIDPPAFKLFHRFGLLLFFLVVVVASEVPIGQASMCDRPDGLRTKRIHQCSFKEELLHYANLFFDDSVVVVGGGGVVANSILPKSSECRFRDNIDYICDSYGIEEVPPVSQFPRNFTRFFLNGTQVSTLRNRSFENLTIECIIIYDNPKLTTLEPDAFVGLAGLKVLIMQNNFHFEMTNVPGLSEDFFRPFVTLSELTHLSLQGNRIYLEGVNSTVSNPSSNGGPCLQYLDLSKNSLTRIGSFFFRAFNCGSIMSLVLHSSDLQSIDEDSFLWISGLQRLDLSSNPKLFETDNVTRSLVHLKNLLTLRLDSNYFNEVPVAVLESVNGSLESLNLTLNIFEELKAGAFPAMPHLTTLYLDVCRITKINKDAFSNLPSLEHLSLTRNFIHEIPPLTNSAQVRQLHFQGFEDDDNPFVIEEDVFVGFGSLEVLTLNTLNLGNLTFNKLNGLNNLTTLRLENSRLRGLEPEVFRATPRLKYLMMAHCTGLDKVTIDNLKGPDCLEVLDLSYIKIFPDRNKSTRDMIDPLAHAKILNLTGSLTNTENALDILRLSSMPELEVLEIGQNAITSWNSTKFGANPKLKRLVLNKNHEYLKVTLAMISDFEKLEELDLSGNKFDCNADIVFFYLMVEGDKEEKKRPEVVGWQHGEGYFCKDSKDDNQYTFKDFAENGIDQDPGFPNNDQDKLVESNDPSVLVFVCAVVGSVVAVSLLIFSAYYAHSNWWYVEYLMARRNTLHKGKSTDSYVYDAFVSYSSDDEEWVHSYLVTNLEKKAEEDDNDDALQLCLHERDFKIGRPIAENIVSCLEESRTCILVLTTSYAKSVWCNFEAQVAQHMFQEQNRSNHLVVVIPSSIPSAHLSKTLKYILKTRTYIEWKSESRSFWKRLRTAIKTPGPKVLQPSVSVIELTNDEKLMSY